MTQRESTRLDMPAEQPLGVQPRAQIPELSLADIQRVAGGKAFGLDGFVLIETAIRPSGFVLIE